MIDLVYPTLCVHCLRVGTPLCDHCQAAIVSLDPHQPEPAIDLINGYTAIGMHTGVLQSSIHALKYQHDKRQAEVLGALLAHHVKRQEWTFDMIIPVPSDLNRLKERGYNQAERIAHFLSLHLVDLHLVDLHLVDLHSVDLHLENQTVIEALHKSQHTESQVGKSSFERQENVKGVFQVLPQFQDRLQSKDVLLIDDVCTTGSTLQACTVALRDAGVKTVYVATVSRAQGIGFDS
jgi:predicted amidophosphoribosyltransferase